MRFADCYLVSERSQGVEFTICADYDSGPPEHFVVKSSKAYPLFLLSQHHPASVSLFRIAGA
jgi:hypothetical protein